MKAISSLFNIYIYIYIHISAFEVWEHYKYTKRLYKDSTLQHEFTRKVKHNLRNYLLRN